eukprot:409323-Pleurochrysis_carterae.AAC.3
MKSLVLNVRALCASWHAAWAAREMQRWVHSRSSGTRESATFGEGIEKRVRGRWQAERSCGGPSRRRMVARHVYSRHRPSRVQPSGTASAFLCLVAPH